MHAWLWNKRSRLSALKEKFTNISVPRGMTEDDEQFARFSRQQPESRQQVDARTKLSGENTILENPTDSGKPKSKGPADDSLVHHFFR